MQRLLPVVIAHRCAGETKGALSDATGVRPLCCVQHGQRGVRRSSVAGSPMVSASGTAAQAMWGRDPQSTLPPSTQMRTRVRLNRSLLTTCRIDGEEVTGGFMCCWLVMLHRVLGGTVVVHATRCARSAESPRPGGGRI